MHYKHDQPLFTFPLSERGTDMQVPVNERVVPDAGLPDEVGYVANYTSDKSDLQNVVTPSTYTCVSQNLITPST